MVQKYRNFSLQKFQKKDDSSLILDSPTSVEKKKREREKRQLPPKLRHGYSTEQVSLSFAPEHAAWNRNVAVLTIPMFRSIVLLFQNDKTHPMLVEQTSLPSSLSFITVFRKMKIVFEWIFKYLFILCKLLLWFHFYRLISHSSSKICLTDFQFIYWTHLRCSWSRIVFRDEKSNYQGVINLRNESFIRMIYTWFSKYKHNFMSFRSNIILIDRFIWIFLIRKMNERWKEFVTAIQFHCGFR